MMQATPKFQFLKYLTSLANAVRLEGITSGQCDFDTRPAVAGFKINASGDVFYCCDEHNSSLDRERGREGGAE